jgi:hypothetical protein
VKSAPRPPPPSEEKRRRHFFFNYKRSENKNNQKSRPVLNPETRQTVGANGLGKGGFEIASTPFRNLLQRLGGISPWGNKCLHSWRMKEIKSRGARDLSINESSFFDDTHIDDLVRSRICRGNTPAQAEPLPSRRLLRQK